MKKVKADFYREVSPPDSLSSMSTGTPSGKSENPDGTEESSSLPTGDTARNIGRPSPDSPSLKTKNLDRSESYGRKPAEKPDFGYVHDSGSGSARVIPYDSGFVNNSSPLRNASRVANRFLMRRGSLTNLSQQIKREYGVELSLLDNGEIISLLKIVIPKDQRGLGLGSKIMGEITDWADQKGKIISLTPSKDFGGSSVSRIVRFYSQFGFKKNKGINKDFRTQDTMLRYPSEAQRGKVAGLIRPPKKLIDEVSEIAQGALARYLFNKEKKGGAVFNSDEIESLNWSYQDFDVDDMMADDELDLEEVSFLFNSTLKMLKGFRHKITDSQEKFILDETVDLVQKIDPNEVFSNIKDYRSDIRLIAWGLKTLYEYTKTRTQKTMISNYARDQYESVRSKLSYRKEERSPLVGGGWDSWRVIDDSLTYPIIVLACFTENPRAKGSHAFYGTHHILRIYFNTDKETWGVFELNQIMDTARHELVHVLQKEISLQKNIRTQEKYPKLLELGLPFSKYDPKYRQQMKEKGEELKTQYKREGLNPNEISIHALDDIEFYSRLLDEVERFNRLHKNPTNKDIRKALETQFFLSLKRHKKKSWDKAVGIFISEAQSNSRKASEVLAGLIKPPQHLLNIVSDFAQGILARYVLKQPSTILAIEDAEWIDETLEDLKDLNSFEDAEELYELLEDFRMEYWDLKKEVLNDYEIPYQVAHHAKMIELKLKEVTGWDQAHTPIKDRIKSVLSKSNKDIIERDLVLSLKVVSDHIKAVQNKIPHKDDNAFKQALSKLNVGYISKDSFYSVDAIIEDETLSLPIDLTIFFEGKRKVLGSHRLIEGKSHRIKIFVPIQRGLSKKDLVQTHNTVRHELVHLVQSEITIRNKLNHDAGLPSSKRGRKYMQHKKEEEAELRSQFRAMGLDPSVVNFHALDDAEFYTRLLDEVEEFKSDYISPTNDQIKRHIRRSSFFRSLKRFKKKNWSKAVGIFISEAQSNTRKASEK